MGGIHRVSVFGDHREFVAEAEGRYDIIERFRSS
jgi:hypothetical protein